MCFLPVYLLRWGRRSDPSSRRTHHTLCRQRSLWNDRAGVLHTRGAEDAPGVRVSDYAGLRPCMRGQWGCQMATQPHVEKTRGKVGMTTLPGGGSAGRTRPRRPGAGQVPPPGPGSHSRTRLPPGTCPRAPTRCNSPAPLPSAADPGMDATFANY